MYTAPKRYTEDELDQRIPLSVAQWHEHVNFCIPPLGRWKEMRSPNPQFGLRGSITTQEACDAAGGTFRPVVFNWMVHVYPFEKDQAKSGRRAPARRRRLITCGGRTRVAARTRQLPACGGLGSFLRILSSFPTANQTEHFPVFASGSKTSITIFATGYCAPRLKMR